MDLRKKAENAFEEAKRLIYLNKVNQEKKSAYEKAIFGKEPPKKSILIELEEEEKILEIASQIFLKEHNLHDSFMGDLEEWIKGKYNLKTKDEKD